MFVADIKEVFLKRKKKGRTQLPIIFQNGFKARCSRRERISLLTKPIFRPFSCAPVGYITTWRNVSKESHVSNAGDKDCYFMLTYFLQSPPFVIRSMTLLFNLRIWELRVNVGFLLRSAKENLTASFTRCYS